MRTTPIRTRYNIITFIEDIRELTHRQGNGLHPRHGKCICGKEVGLGRKELKDEKKNIVIIIPYGRVQRECIIILKENIITLAESEIILRLTRDMVIKKYNTDKGRAFFSRAPVSNMSKYPKYDVDDAVPVVYTRRRGQWGAKILNGFSW